jgi:hypothetical protein
MGVILSATYRAIVLATSLWIAYDSEKYDWGPWKHPRRPEWHCAAESPATWFLMCATLWPAFFPGYFWDRRFARRKPDKPGEGTSEDRKAHDPGRQTRAVAHSTARGAVGIRRA